MSLFGSRLVKNAFSRPIRRMTKHQATRGLHFEPLETRNLLTVTLNSITGPDANGFFDVPAGKDLYVPLTGTDAGQSISYTATSSDPNVHVSILNGNPSLKITVSGTDSSNQAFTGTMTFQLFQDLSPNTVNTIVNLVNSGFYNNQSFYRIIQDFVIQGGAGNSTTAPKFNDEFNVNLSFNSPGLLAMANAGPNTNSSEFFITDTGLPVTTTSNTGTPQYLNFRHPIFGQLTSGLDVYNHILNAKGISSSSSTPNPAVTITSATIFTDNQNGVVQISEPNGFTGTSTITITATGSDTSTATRTFTVNAVAPTATSLAPLNLDPVLDQTTFLNKPVTFTISSNSLPANAADIVTFSITAVTGFTGTPSNVTVQVTPGANGTATVTLTPTTGFTGTINLLAHVDDSTGNYHDAQQFSLTVSPIATITTVTNPITIGNAATTTASGTGAANATVVVTASDGTHTSAPQQATVAANGTWSVAGIDVTGLNDGTITYKAVATDTSSNTSQTTLTSTKTTVSITGVPAKINAANVATGTVSGKGQANATISLTVSDGTHTTTARTATIGIDGNWSITNVDVTALNDGTITYTAVASDGASHTAQATSTTAKDVAPPAVAVTSVTTPVNLNNQANTTIHGTGDIGAAISVTVSDGTHTTAAATTTVANDGTWTITGINVAALNDGTITYTAVATDTFANTASTTSTSVKNTVAPTVTVTTVTNPVNLANLKTTSASGTGTPAGAITLTVTDGPHKTTTYTTTIGNDGNWSIANIDVSGLNDGSITYTAIVTNASQNTAQNSLSSTKLAVTLTTVTSQINSNSATQTSASGTGQVGAAITLTVTDGTHTTQVYNGTVLAGGVWTITGINVSALNDGTITYKAVATDTAENSAESTKTATKDTLAPSVNVTTVTNPVNAGNKAAATASGTTTAGSTVTVVATDAANHTTTIVTATVDGSGNWTATGIDTSALDDGTITFTATARDTAGNSATAVLTSTKDTVVPTVAITNVPTLIKPSNVSSVSASGTVTVGSTVTVVARDAANHTTASVTATVDASGNWTATGIDTTGLNDGTVTFTATATGNHGNTATTTSTTTKDTTAPAVVISTVTSPITADNATKTSITGTGEANSTIVVTVTDGTNTTAAQTVTVAANGTWSINNLDVSALKDGTLTYKAVATDAANNSATTTKTTQKAALNTASLEGYVYLNYQNAAKGDSDVGMKGVILTLNGVDGQGNPIPSQTAITDADGHFIFSSLPAGTYSITEMQPASISDGATTKGTLGGTQGTNVISNIVVASGAQGSKYYFSEQGVPLAMISLNMFLSSSPSTADLLNGLITDGGPSAPVVLSITKAQADPAGTGTVAFTVTFNEDVSGLTAADFAVLQGTGVTGASIAGVTGSGHVYTVTVNTGTGSGTLGIKLVDDDSVVGAGNRPLGGVGAGNDTFIGPSYTINAALNVTIVTVTSPINAAGAANTGVSGTATAGATISVVATDGTNSTAALTTTAASDGTWSITGINVASLVDGTITYKATATSNGATATSSKTATKDAVAPNVTMTAVSNPIIASNVSSTVASGTVTAGSTVKVVATDGANHSSAIITATVDAQGNWTATGINVSGLNDGTITFTATATDAAGNTQTASKTATKDTTTSVAISTVTDPIGSANVASVSASGTTEIGSSVEVVVKDAANKTSAIYDATVNGQGNWSVTGIDVTLLNDGTLTFTATVTDTSGNTQTATKTATKNTVANVTVDTVTSPVNAANAGSISASGTSAAGSTVKVQVKDVANQVSAVYNATVDASGNWTASGIDVTLLNNGTLTITATVTASNGNTGTATKTTTKDTVTAITFVSVLSPINNANQEAVTASGTTEIGATVKVVATDAANHTSAVYNAVVDDEGNWSVTGIDVSDLDEGTITFTATATDTVGNTKSETKTATKDTVAPDVTVDTVTDPINLQNLLNLTITGTTDVGATVKVVATDTESHSSTEYTAVVDPEGNWSVQNFSVNPLSDGIITFTATATDGVGNTKTATKTATKQTISVLTVTDPINLANRATVSVTGKVQTGNGITVSVVAKDAANHTSGAVNAVIDGEGNWTASGIDVTALDEGTITFTATATDASDHTASSTKTALKDTVAEVAVTTVLSPINNVNKTAVSISGTTEIGATVKVVAHDAANNPSAIYDAVVDATGHWSVVNIDVTDLDDGTITFTATATDTAGNTNIATKTATKDTVAPTVNIATLAANITGATSHAVPVSGTVDVGAAVKVVAHDAANHTSAVYDAVVDEEGNWNVAAMDVSGLDEGALTFTATATDTVGNTATSTKGSVKDTVASVTVATVTNPINAAGVTTVTATGTTEVGSTVKVVVKDVANHSSAVYDAVVDAEGGWSVANIDVTDLDDGTLTFTATATDAQSNTGIATKSAIKDTVASVAITPIASTINTAAAAAFNLAGTTEVGSTVKVIATDAATHSSTEYNAVVDVSGGWTVTGMDLHLLDDGTLTFTATATDIAGNTKTATATATKNTVAPSISIVAPDNAINSDTAANVTVSGTATVGATVQVVATDTASHTSTTYTPTVDGEGNWSITDFDTTGLTDGPITFTATATNAVGNSATDTQTVILDTLAPAVAITTVTDPINSTNVSAGTASGTGEPGASISVAATNGLNQTPFVDTTVDNDGNWSVSGIDLSGLVDGVVVYVAKATDDAGNTAQATKGAMRDVVVPTVSITPITGAINATATAAFSLAGTVEAGSTVKVIAKDAANHPSAEYTAVVDVSGGWTVTGMDLQLLNDGTITFTATAKDFAGNTKTATATATKDTEAPAISITSFTDPITPTNLAAVSVSGKGEPGALISVWATDDITNNPAKETTVDNEGNWSVTGVDLSGLPDGVVYLVAETTDGAGNARNDSVSASLDLAAPTVSSINRVSASPTSSHNVQFTVTFSEGVNGVDAADFALVASTGISGAEITGITGSGAQFVVSVNAGTGTGTLGLNLVDDNSITDNQNNPLGGLAVGDGNFTGQVYDIIPAPLSDQTANNDLIDQAFADEDLWT